MYCVKLVSPARFSTVIMHKQEQPNDGQDQKNIFFVGDPVKYKVLYSLNSGVPKKSNLRKGKTKVSEVSDYIYQPLPKYSYHAGITTFKGYNFVEVLVVNHFKQNNEKSLFVDQTNSLRFAIPIRGAVSLTKSRLSKNMFYIGSIGGNIFSVSIHNRIPIINFLDSPFVDIKSPNDFITIDVQLVKVSSKNQFRKEIPNDDFLQYSSHIRSFLDIASKNKIPTIISEPDFDSRIFMELMPFSFPDNSSHLYVSPRKINFKLPNSAILHIYENGTAVVSNGVSNGGSNVINMSGYSSKEFKDTEYVRRVVNIRVLTPKGIEVLQVPYD